MILQFDHIWYCSMLENLCLSLSHVIVFCSLQGPLHASLVEAVRAHMILRTSPYCKRIFTRKLLKKWCVLAYGKIVPRYIKILRCPLIRTTLVYLGHILSSILLNLLLISRWEVCNVCFLWMTSRNLRSVKIKFCF